MKGIILPNVIQLTSSQKSTPTHQVNRWNYSDGSHSYTILPIDATTGSRIVTRTSAGDPILTVDYKVYVGTLQECQAYKARF